MSERRSDDATQIITRVTGSQPQEERDGAAKAKRARAALEGVTGKPLTPEQEAEISAGVLQGLDIGTIVGDLADGKSFLPTPPREVTGRGQATVRTPDQEIMRIVKSTGQDVSPEARRDLERGIRTPDQIIGAVETTIIPRVPARRTGRPMQKPRR
jgi:hypothetical protein